MGGKQQWESCMSELRKSSLSKMENWDQRQIGAMEKDTSFVVPWPPCAESTSPFQCHSYNPWSMPFAGVQEDGSGASASRSHSQAEKRRRDRINAQLATLRKLIPKSEKMDKAALLGSVVEHVKDLKRKALEVSKSLTVPTDVDEVTIDCYLDDQEGSSVTGITSTNKENNNVFIKASVCCDDRPELFSELTQALKGLKLTTVRADMASLGGRVKSILVLCTKDSKEGVCLNSIIQSLKGVLSRIVASSSSMGSSYRMKSKRQRFFLHSH